MNEYSNREHQISEPDICTDSTPVSAENPQSYKETSFILVDADLCTDEPCSKEESIEFYGYEAEDDFTHEQSAEAVIDDDSSAASILMASSPEEASRCEEDSGCISEPEIHSEKKSPVGMALFMAATILLSGISGYTGSYIANQKNQKNTTATPALPIATHTSDSLSVSDVVAMTADSVVEIMTGQESFFGQSIRLGAGSGVIVRSDGYILTNYHVIDNGSQITVRLRDGKTYEAKLVGFSEHLDLAVIKIEATDLHAVSYGNSDQVIVGESAIAIGNPLGELGGTVTFGIISAINRDITIGGEKMSLIQTSAAVNRGNSGGGLFNSQGQLIGIVTAKSSGSNIEGIGFAIPANVAQSAAESIIKDGYVKGGPVRIGITLADIQDPQAAFQYGFKKAGVYVTDIARENGFKPGDRIIRADGKTVQNAQEIKELVSKHKAGDKLSFQVERDGNIFDLTVTLSEAP